MVNSLYESWKKNNNSIKTINTSYELLAQIVIRARNELVEPLITLGDKRLTNNGLHLCVRVTGENLREIPDPEKDKILLSDINISIR